MQIVRFASNFCKCRLIFNRQGCNGRRSGCVIVREGAHGELVFQSLIRIGGEGKFVSFIEFRKIIKFKKF